MNNKSEVIGRLNVKFNEIFKEFYFLKFFDVYIDLKGYFLYIRGRKYNELGSLGVVILLIVVYYLIILEEVLNKEIDLNYLNLLMIDILSKNLGVFLKFVEF